MSVHLWLRAETKPMEERTSLTPTFAKKLLDRGFKITVEHCKQRIFSIDEYEKLGCDIAESHSWQTDAPDDAIILGLKEFSEDATFPLRHRHIQFAHVYKEQQGWERVLQRFIKGGGTLYDLEYLTDDNNHRVAAFGYWAGYAGCAVALKAWVAKQQQSTLAPLTSYASNDKLLDELGALLDSVATKPRLIVIGAKGRSGQGAIKLADQLSLEYTAWDVEETAVGGPFPEILEHDIFINCVFVQQLIPPFITTEMLANVDKKLSVICDVSCDPYGDYNPVPVYKECTTFDKPVLQLGEGEAAVDLVAIDHLPSLLPRESSEDYCEQLFDTLAALDHIESGAWQRAEQVFIERTKPLR